jgi:hypothetical protein
MMIGKLKRRMIKEKSWYKSKGYMQLFKNNKLIREYRFHDTYNRRRMLKIWNSEIKPNGIDEYYLLIKLDQIIDDDDDD